MKIQKLLILILMFPSLISCEKELKEHPLPPQMKRQIEMKNDPKVQAQVISGTLKLDASLKDKTPKGATLFIYARPKGVSGGPPLAVKKTRRYDLPYDFEIGPMDVMIPDTPFEGEITLSARLDKDGMAGGGPGDLEGQLDTKAGEKNVELILNNQVPMPAIDASKSISGTIEIDPALAEYVSKESVLFLFTRPEGVESGPPLAVTLAKEVKFPYPFELGQAQVMIPGNVFEGPMSIHARLDHDGNAKANKGDLRGSIKANAGDQGVKIILDGLVEGEG